MIDILKTQNFIGIWNVLMQSWDKNHFFSSNKIKILNSRLLSNIIPIKNDTQTNAYKINLTNTISR